MTIYRFCPVCGDKLRMRYPGGDPENGPAEPRCSDDSHPSIRDIENEAIGALDTDELRNLIAEREMWDRAFPDPPDDHQPAGARLYVPKRVWRADRTTRTDLVVRVV